MNFTSVPYGNANEKQAADGTWTFTCQHGVNECIGNMYEACAMEHNPGLRSDGSPVWWPFFYCMEKSGNAAVESVASGCATNNGLNWTVITTCAGSDPSKGSTTDGNPLMHSLAVITNNLQPPHQWTPWVVVDNNPLTSAQLDLPLTPIVCAAYTKKNPVTCTPPTACNKLQLDFPGKFYD